MSKDSPKINKNQWIPRRSIKTRLSRRTSAKRWSRKWYSNLCAMKSDAVYALSKGTSQHSAMPVQTTTPPCPHVANVPPKRNNYFFKNYVRTNGIQWIPRRSIKYSSRKEQARNADQENGTQTSVRWNLIQFMLCQRVNCWSSSPRPSRASWKP